MKIVQDGYVCVDCMFMMANGDGPEDATPEAVQALAEACAGWSPAGDDENPDLEFSWSQCRCCGSMLGGSRYWAVKLGEGED